MSQQVGEYFGHQCDLKKKLTNYLATETEMLVACSDCVHDDFLCAR